MILKLTPSERRTLVNIVNTEVIKSCRNGLFGKRYVKLLDIQKSLNKCLAEHKKQEGRVVEDV